MLAGGVAGDPGVVFWPALPVDVVDPPGDVPVPGELCATAQLAQPSTIANNVNLLLDIE